MTTVTPEGVTPPEFDAKVDQLAKLLEDIRNIKVDQGRSWKWLKRGGGFIAFDVVVTIIGLLGGLAMYSAIQQIEAVQASSCYFTGLVLNNYDVHSPARLAYKGGPKAYDDAFRGMYAGAVKQGCPGIAPPKFP